MEAVGMQDTFATETPDEVEVYKSEINRYMREISVLLERISRNQAATQRASEQTRAVLNDIRRIRMEKHER